MASVNVPRESWPEWFAARCWAPGAYRDVQTVQYNLLIAAPVERCFRLALSAELARDAMDGWRSEREAEEQRLLTVGDVLRWGSQRRIRSMGAFTETIQEMRAQAFVRRSFAGPRFGWGDGQQNFATMNDGTWMHEEYRFAAAGGLFAGLRERRLKKAMKTMVKARGLFLKSVAEGSGWAHYLPEERSAVSRGA